MLNTKYLMNLPQRRAILYILGACAIIACIPALLQPDDEYKAEDSYFRDAIQSDVHKFVLAGSMGVALPMLIELTLERLFFVDSWNELTCSCPSRLLLFINMAVTPALLVHFGVGQERVRATFALQQIRTIVNGIVCADQFVLLESKVYTWPLLLCLYLAIIISATIRAHITLFHFSNVAFLITFLLRLAVVAMFSYAIGKHIWMFKKGVLDKEGKQGTTTSIELLMLLPLAGVVMSRDFRYNTVYEMRAVSVIGLTISSSLFSICLNVVLTSQRKSTQAHTREQLKMKRLFVRFISHEVSSSLLLFVQIITLKCLLIRFAHR